MNCCEGLVFGIAPLRTAPGSDRHDKGPGVGVAVGIGVTVLVAVGTGGGVAVEAGGVGAEQAARMMVNAGIKTRRMRDLKAVSLRWDNAPHYTRGVEDTARRGCSGLARATTSSCHRVECMSVSGGHRRRSTRLRDYDYGRAGAYYVTIVAYQRACLFGRIVNGEMWLSGRGRIAQTRWTDIPQHFPQSELGTFVTTPNHVHGIVVLHGAPRSRGVLPYAGRYNPIVVGLVPPPAGNAHRWVAGRRRRQLLSAKCRRS
jgi:hypothetical protein